MIWPTGETELNMPYIEKTGVNKIKEQMKNSSIDESMLVSNEAIILSVTKEERENPKVISGSRRKRIAKGSGINIDEINQLIKKFEEMGKILKKIQMGGMNNMMNITYKSVGV